MGGAGLFSGMVGFVSGRVIGFGLDLADLAGHGCGLQARFAGGQLRVLGEVEDSSVSIFVSTSHSWMGLGICHANRRWWPTWSAEGPCGYQLGVCARFRPVLVDHRHHGGGTDGPVPRVVGPVAWWVWSRFQSVTSMT